MSIAFFAIVAWFIWPYYIRSQRAGQYEFEISKTIAQIAQEETSSKIRDMTRQSVVVEGPCNGGCYGGVLSQQSPTVAGNIVPGLQDYDGGTTSIIWLNEIKPTSVERRNNVWGDDELTISGKMMNDKKIYFAVVPTYLTEPSLQWIFVDKK